VLPAVRPGGQVRVWSAACSSGEEPYSVAMLLAAEMGLTNWEVLGTDICARVLESARSALFELGRAEQISPDYLRRFCLKGKGPHSGKLMIDKSLRERVKFARANLNEPLPDFGQFDVILLRNVMIYFNTPTKQRVIEHLIPALKPGGYFITGHCDTLAGVTHGLTTCSASVHRKAAA
jgi:chemotaxis protein methyltransferase CheR